MLVSFSISFFLLSSIFQKKIKVQSIDSDIYNAIKGDLTELNFTCAEQCQFYELDSRSGRNCECGVKCAIYRTCCLDSFYINHTQTKVKHACRFVENGDAYFMVDQCSSKDSVWANLCNDDNYDFQTGDDDIQKIVPVTSLFSSITYKNFYCFRCHETTDEFKYWSVNLTKYLPRRIFSSKRLRGEDGSILFSYSKERNSWTISYNANSSFVPVKISMIVPAEMCNITHKCIKDVISDCSDEWSDDETRLKCQSYMAIKEAKINLTSKKLYKNIHCALCNFENSNDIVCRKQGYDAYGNLPDHTNRHRYGNNKGFGFNSGRGNAAFSFARLLDINQSDGDLVGKVKKCSRDHLWDPFAKKCRKLSCALPGYTVKNEKCVKNE